MRTLYHYTLDPYSRAVRVQLAEKSLEFDLVLEKTWERRRDFLAMNPACETPVLIEPDGHVFAGFYGIMEHLEERYARPNMLGGTLEQRAETRRLLQWFGVKFQQEVTKNLLHEKIYKRFSGIGGPQSSAIRAGHVNLKVHLDYISFLAERRNWLAGLDFSLADMMAAAQISAHDYLGDISWTEHPEAKNWYAKVKSRPCFRAILGDHLPGLPPPRHYADLDF